MDNVRNGPWTANSIEGSVAHTPSPAYDGHMTDLTRQEVDAKLEATQAKVDARLASFEASIKTGFAELRAEIANMRADNHKSTIEVTRWVVGFGIAILGTVFALSKTAEKPSAPATVQPPPIIVTVPGAGAAQAPAPAAASPSPPPAAPKR